MTKLKNDRDELFVRNLRAHLDDQTEREPSAVSEGKAKFLAQAKLFQSSPVTQVPAQRHSKWNLIHLKEVKMGTLITIVVILGLALGGTSVVYAAQDDLPGEPLYQVKLLSEGARLDLASDPEKKMDLDLQFALRRLDEIEEMIEAGLVPPDMSFARLENQLMHAVGQATLLDEEEVPGALLRIRQTLQERVRLQESELETPDQTRLRTLLQERLGWLNEGIADPERFTNEARIGWEAAPNQGEVSGPQTGIEGDEDWPGNQAQPTEIPGMGPGNATQSPWYGTPEPGYLTPGPGYQTPEPGGQTPGEGNGNTNGDGNNGKKP